MADPNRSNDILTAARHIFTPEGYNKASIKKFVQEANLKSSALIYWYFENKEALFQAVISSNVPLAHLAAAAESLFQQPPEIVLPELLRHHISVLDEEEMRQLIRIVLPEMLRDPEISNNFSVFINPIFEMIQQYLQQRLTATSGSTAVIFKPIPKWISFHAGINRRSHRIRRSMDDR